MNRTDTVDLNAYYHERYEVVAEHFFEDGDRSIIRDPDDVRVCRFCARDSGHTTFHSDAHAIPEFLGNRKVFCWNECDDCNGRFGREYEDHLAKWCHLLRSLLKIRGKAKYPKFKSNSFQVEPERDHLLEAKQMPNAIKEA